MPDLKHEAMVATIRQINRLVAFEICENAKVHEFRDYDRQSDIAGNSAVPAFQYEIIYQRSGERYRATVIYKTTTPIP